MRTGGKVRRESFSERDAALAALEAEGREIERAGRREAIDLRYRTFAPAELVAGRVELRGPGGLLGRTSAGVDVRGDGSAAAWRGLVHKRLVETRGGESAYAALRRELITS